MHFLYPVLLLYQQSVLPEKIKNWQKTGKTHRAWVWLEPPPARNTGILLRGVAQKQHPPRTKLVHCQPVSAPIWCTAEVSTHSLPGCTNLGHCYVASHQVSGRSHCQRTNLVQPGSEDSLTLPAHQFGA